MGKLFDQIVNLNSRRLLVVLGFFYLVLQNPGMSTQTLVALTVVTVAALFCFTYNPDTDKVTPAEPK